MNNLIWKQFASKYLFDNNAVHVSAFKLDVVVTTAAVAKAIGSPERGPAALLCGVKESRIVAIDKTKGFPLCLATRRSSAFGEGCFHAAATLAKFDIHCFPL